MDYNYGNKDDRLEAVHICYSLHREKPPFWNGKYTTGHQNPGYGDAALFSCVTHNNPHVVKAAIENPLVSLADNSLPPERNSLPRPLPYLPSIQKSLHERLENFSTLSELPFGPRTPDDSLATSPLGQLLISPSKRPPQEQLPVLQFLQPLRSITSPTSEPQSSPTTPSSQGGPTNQLPLITAPPQHPNPQDLTNPAPRSSHPSTNKTEPGDKLFEGFPYNISRKSPPVKDPGRNAYPTPIDETGPAPESHSSPGPTTGGTYKCTHPGCTAAPFYNKYLLNSHANVHSEERPYFCSLSGCERGAGGKGFKRKNEMIRHGLVHNSPGYVCPFCLDQQRKYPRPDNLQRHVKTHHLDRAEDDPVLRDALSQRAEGPSRKRRRRGNT